MLLQKPLEVKVVLTEKCNYHCDFCFNKSGLQSNSQLSEKSAKKIISKAADAGIEKIRFTGGEPLLWQDLLSILGFAKKQGMHVMLNTNGSLVDEKNAAKLCMLVDDFLVSMHAFDAAAEKRLAGKALFNKKINAIKLLAKNHAFIRAATILTKQNICNLEKMRQLVDSLPFDQWVLLRPMPNAQNNNPINNNDVKFAVEKLLRFNSERKKRERFFIENALPFCSYKPEKVAMVALGAVHEDGNDSLIVDSSGKIKPSYFFETALGNAVQDNFIECWNSSFMQQLHSMHFLPPECKKCSYLMPCLGGSRFCALQAKGSLNALDPLAKPKQYEKDLFLG